MLNTSKAGQDRIGQVFVYAIAYFISGDKRMIRGFPSFRIFFSYFSPVSSPLSMDLLF